MELQKLLSKARRAAEDYNMIEEGDKIGICISGGKDSMLLAKCFQELKRHGKNNFEASEFCKSRFNYG